ncbi:hypothetical protein M3Y99_01212400 [Aphelenchoides fujianensis]|nr:hypothetical protein M3Y99_01212400 [Aphelenchoides fujianensis]
MENVEEEFVEVDLKEQGRQIDAAMADLQRLLARSGHDREKMRALVAFAEQLQEAKSIQEVQYRRVMDDCKRMKAQLDRCEQLKRERDAKRRTAADLLRQIAEAEAERDRMNRLLAARRAQLSRANNRAEVLLAIKEAQAEAIASVPPHDRLPPVLSAPSSGSGDHSAASSEQSGGRKSKKTAGGKKRAAARAQESPPAVEDGAAAADESTGQTGASTSAASPGTSGSQ